MNSVYLNYLWAVARLLDLGVRESQVTLVRLVIPQWYAEPVVSGTLSLASSGDFRITSDRSDSTVVPEHVQVLVPGRVGEGFSSKELSAVGDPERWTLVDGRLFRALGVSGNQFIGEFLGEPFELARVSADLDIPFVLNPRGRDRVELQERLGALHEVLGQRPRRSIREAAVRLMEEQYLIFKAAETGLRGKYGRALALRKAQALAPAFKDFRTYWGHYLRGSFGLTDLEIAALTIEPNLGAEIERALEMKGLGVLDALAQSKGSMLAHGDKVQIALRAGGLVSGKYGGADSSGHILVNDRPIHMADVEPAFCSMVFESSGN